MLQKFFPKIEGILDQARLKAESKDRMVENVKRLNEKLILQQKENTHLIMQQQNVEAEIDEQQRQIQELQSVRKGLQTRSEEAQSITKDLVAVLAQMNVQATEFQSRLADISSQVVTEEEKAEQIAMSDKLSRVKIQQQQLNDRRKDLQTDCELSSKCNVQMQDIKAALLETLRDLDGTKAIKAEIQTLLNSKNNLLVKIEDRDLHLGRTEERLRQLHDQMAQAQAVAAARIRAILEDTSQLRTQLEDVRRTQTQDQIALQDMEAEGVLLAKEADGIRDQVLRMDSYVAAKYQELTQAIERREKMNDEIAKAFHRSKSE